MFVAACGAVRPRLQLGVARARGNQHGDDGEDSRHGRFLAEMVRRREAAANRGEWCVCQKPPGGQRRRSYAVRPMFRRRLFSRSDQRAVDGWIELQLTCPYDWAFGAAPGKGTSRASEAGGDSMRL